MELEKAIKQKKFESVQQKAVINILYTSSWLTYEQNAVFKQFDLSMPQFNVLRILKGQHPNSASVNLLIERMIDQSSNASRIVEKLRQKGWVDRRTCPDDRRQVDVLINDDGLKLLEKVGVELRAYHKSMATLTDEEYDQLNTLLDKLRNQQKSKQ